MLSGRIAGYCTDRCSLMLHEHKRHEGHAEMKRNALLVRPDRSCFGSEAAKEPERFYSQSPAGDGNRGQGDVPWLLIL